MSTSYDFTSFNPIPYSANLFISSSPSIKSISLLPSLDASTSAARVNEPVVIKTPFSIFVLNEPRKSLISGAPTAPLYLLHWNATLKLKIPLMRNFPVPSMPPSPDFLGHLNIRESAFSQQPLSQFLESIRTHTEKYIRNLFTPSFWLGGCITF